MKIVTSLNLNIRNKNIAKRVFFQAGYTFFNKDYILKTLRGKFHIKYGGYWAIHYDVDTYNGRHMTLPSEFTVQEERKRLSKIINSITKDFIKGKQECVWLCVHCKSKILRRGLCDSCKKERDTRKKVYLI